MFRAPALNWPYQFPLGEQKRTSQIVSDHALLLNYVEVTRNLDRVDFTLDGPVAVANNLTFEFSPEVDSIVYEMKIHAKLAGATITLRLKVNGVTVDTITSTGTAVVRKTPNPQKLVTPLDLLSVDCTAVTGVWTGVTFTVIMEPRYS